MVNRKYNWQTPNSAQSTVYSCIYKSKDTIASDSNIATLMSLRTLLSLESKELKNELNTDAP
ncbi:DEHA2A12716p [Debaryomyces hansenii CBS767]|uniref:DEHA2A12716p n=1 Tax=Debaryomyces hansenii (strain ATCC 36239 / CBS 767 / BCRC 21394 / JCM 1990 / NBRC 0083 / IGC 2968) TaxID=284592 RepID=B5RSV3_DEBHA|nr:DEHA2A12716p [Debaryomyces hansenii CBS767]CAR65409.1 DEHA2A12716p [Debaryomyces hansenii CBS767]|eukprot:XP_002770033.1 DEHA2A12716p [Debaryomyces hansenii CBS767]